MTRVEQTTGHVPGKRHIIYVFRLAPLSDESWQGPAALRRAECAATRLCDLMTSLLALRHATADVTVLIARDRDEADDCCSVSGAADDPVKIAEDLVLDASELAMYAGRSGQELDEAEILRGDVRLTAGSLADRLVGSWMRHRPSN